MESGEERQLLLRKMLQREPSPPPDTRAAARRPNFLGNLLPWAAVPGFVLFWARDIGGMKKMLCKC